jgi:hypothetical protein
MVATGLLFGVAVSNMFFVSGRYTNVVNMQQTTDSSTIATPELSPIELYLRNPLVVPPNVQPPNLPGIRTEEEDAVERKFYGGKGDSKHLGGFTDLDLQGVSPAVWKYMVGSVGVRSVLDIGCGRGISTSWFGLHGCKILCKVLVSGSQISVFALTVKTTVPQASRGATTLSKNHCYPQLDLGIASLNTIFLADHGGPAKHTIWHGLSSFWNTWE